jgi:hypothetical protein
VRVALYLCLALLGAALGVAGAFVHHVRLHVLGVSLPLGILLALLTGLGLAVAGGLLTRSRLGAGLVAGPWLLGALPFASERPEGDLIISGTPFGYAYLLGTALLATIAVTLPYRDLTRSPDNAGR